VLALLYSNTSFRSTSVKLFYGEIKPYLDDSSPNPEYNNSDSKAKQV